ncbi:hypothetical protein INP57_03900 [Saccharopolyspora sp. HNM0986]|uniref:hypothetical protein n=1 Tax=Saccharopolyspora galaxeae TaxID=2781241 RepID=UPI00190DA1C8|nr:hypothetical protein [Saccharopolyspora sp. HNM0986]MBK0865942.1 hypothetical protein [Saccharopolyspora sp. HNM0986]
MPTLPATARSIAPSRADSTQKARQWPEMLLDREPGAARSPGNSTGARRGRRSQARQPIEPQRTDQGNAAGFAAEVTAAPARLIPRWRAHADESGLADQCSEARGSARCGLNER